MMTLRSNLSQQLYDWALSEKDVNKVNKLICLINKYEMLKRMEDRKNGNKNSTNDN